MKTAIFVGGPYDHKCREMSKVLPFFYVDICPPLNITCYVASSVDTIKANKHKYRRLHEDFESDFILYVSEDMSADEALLKLMMEYV